MTGGGSGGHITPLLSVAQELKARCPGCRVIYIGFKEDQMGDSSIKQAGVDEIFKISAGKFRRYHGENFWQHLVDVRTIALNLRDLLRVVIGTFQAISILGKTNPDIIFIKGGFVGVPVGIAARLKSVPFATHDSDAVAGLANRLIGRFARLHMTALPPEFYSYPHGKVSHVGIPIDKHFKPLNSEDRQRAKRALDFDPVAPVLLIMGGGQGAAKINRHVVLIAPNLFSSFKKLRLIHITGPANLSSVEADYQKLLPEQNDRVTVMDFTDQLYKYTSAADLVVARAGATTLAELAAQAQACIVIPHPALAGGHQLENAQRLLEARAIKIVPDSASPQTLLQAIQELLSSSDLRTQLGQRLAGFANPGSAGEIAKILIDMTGPKSKKSSDA